VRGRRELFEGPCAADSREQRGEGVSSRANMLKLQRGNSIESTTEVKTGKQIFEPIKRKTHGSRKLEGGKRGRKEGFCTRSGR